MNSNQTNEPSAEQLHRLLEDWRALTFAETVSIRASDWNGLEELHAKKLVLQQLIEDSEAKFSHNENIPLEKRSAVKQQLRQVASQLLALEEKNRTALSEQMAQADTQLKLSNKAISSLRHVQQAYGVSDRSFWQAYS
jgi:hypothetical protein